MLTAFNQQNRVRCVLIGFFHFLSILKSFWRWSVYIIFILLSKYILLREKVEQKYSSLKSHFLETVIVNLVHLSLLFVFVFVFHFFVCLLLFCFF